MQSKTNTPITPIHLVCENKKNNAVATTNANVTVAIKIPWVRLMWVKLMDEKFDTVENCEEKLCEVRILAGIAERFDDVAKTALQNKHYGSRPNLHLRT